jgi:cytochrome c oxidase cbb3-type subunit 3
MSSPCRNPDGRVPASRLLTIALVTLCGVFAGDASAQQQSAAPDADRGPNVVSVSGLIPGGASQPPPDPIGQQFEGNKEAIAQGKQMFDQMNCSGCHFKGGGGMGPALMSGNWRYGGKIDQIYTSIAQGRPNGMPSWQGTLVPTLIWDLAAYVKTFPETAPASVPQLTLPDTPATQ